MTGKIEARDKKKENQRSKKRTQKKKRRSSTQARVFVAVRHSWRDDLISAIHSTNAAHSRRADTAHPSPASAEVLQPSLAWPGREEGEEKRQPEIFWRCPNCAPALYSVGFHEPDVAKPAQVSRKAKSCVQISGGASRTDRRRRGWTLRQPAL